MMWKRKGIDTGEGRTQEGWWLERGSLTGGYWVGLGGNDAGSGKGGQGGGV